jgi:hypothetical protein
MKNALPIFLLLIAGAYSNDPHLRNKQKYEDKKYAYDFYIGASYCFYSKIDMTFYYTFTGPFVIEGTFEAKTGRILTQKHTLYADVRGYCKVEPEWGEDYIDENCVKMHLAKWNAVIVDKYYAPMRERSIYRQCEQWQSEIGD